MPAVFCGSGMLKWEFFHAGYIESAVLRHVAAHSGDALRHSALGVM
jgi:hypothetical protein